MADCTFGWLASHESYQPEVLVEQAVLAERHGFDLVLGSDHFHPWVDHDSASGFVWAWLGAVAQATSHIKLATSVTCPLFHYHPAMVAQAAATVDRLSGGRFMLGVGTGENINEGPMGFAFPAYPERIARMDEALTIIQALFEGEKLDYSGDYYTCEAARLYSPPVGELPIFMAAGGPKSAAFAGSRADGLLTSVRDPAVSMERVVEPFRLQAAKRGVEDPPIVATRWVVFAENDAEALAAIASMRGLRAPGRLEAVDPAVLRQRADDLRPSELLASYTVVSSTEELIEAYAPLVTDLGASHVSIQVASTDPSAVIELVGQCVVPELRLL